MSKDFGNRVKEARLRAGMTQSQLAERIDASVNHVSAIERGVYETRVDTLRKMAVALGTTTDYLVFGTKSSDSPLEAAYLKASRLSEADQEWIARYMNAAMTVDIKTE